MSGVCRILHGIDWADLLPVLLLGLACWGIRRVGAKEEKPPFLDKKQGLAWRGIFACTVMLFHLASEYDKAGFLFPRFEYWGPLSVAVFLGLSGYGTFVQVSGGGVVADQYLQHFWRRRLKALWGPYALFAVLSLVQWWRGDWELGERVADQLGVVEFGWFATVLTGYYIAFWWGNRNGRAGSGASVVMTVTAVLAWTSFWDVASEWVPHGGIHWYISNGALLTGLFMGWRSEVAKRLLQDYGKVVLTLGVLGVILHGSYDWYGVVARHDIFRFVYNAFWVVVLGAVGMKWRLDNVVLHWLGNVSYELYLVHGWVMWEVRHWAPNIDGAGYIWLVAVASLVLADITHRLWLRIARVMECLS